MMKHHMIEIADVAGLSGDLKIRATFHFIVAVIIADGCGHRERH